MTDDYDYDIEELRQEVQAQKRYARALARHPLDPDYPELEEEDE
jgi:hypothetical protein